MREELDKFHPLEYKGILTQASWDLFEEIEDTLYNKALKEDVVIRSIRYKITTMMEICNPTLDDYKWLNRMLEIVNREMEKQQR